MSKYMVRYGIIKFLLVPVFILVVCGSKKSFGQKNRFTSVQTGYSLSIIENEILDYHNGSGISFGATYFQPILKEKNIPISATFGLLFENKSSYINSYYIYESGIVIGEVEVFTVFNYLTTPITIDIFPFKRFFYLSAGVYSSYLLDSFFSSSPIYYSQELDYGIKYFFPEQPESAASFNFGVRFGFGFLFNTTDRTVFTCSYMFSRGLTDLYNDPNFSSSSFYLQSHFINLGFGIKFISDE